MMTAPIPTSEDAVQAVLPAVRHAARASLGRVRMIFLAPFLPMLLRIAGELLVKFLMSWLTKQSSPEQSLKTMARQWDDGMMPEVRVAMSRVAAGEFDEDAPPSPTRGDRS